MAQKRYSTVVFGCGNRILGDDGFGPAVIDALNAGGLLPDTVTAIDAGTAVRDYLFDYLLSPENIPGNIVILGAVNIEGERPGSIFFVNPDDLPRQRVDDFSLHQFPGVNLLEELTEHTDIKVSILVGQVDSIPDAIAPGLSPCMQQAVSIAKDKLMKHLAASS